MDTDLHRCAVVLHWTEEEGAVYKRIPIEHHHGLAAHHTANTLYFTQAEIGQYKTSSFIVP